MKIFTFSASTPAEALKKAKDEFGDEAVIIETKTIRKKTISEDGLYEIIVGVDEKILEEAKLKKRLSQTKPKDIKKESEDILFDISEAAKQISNISKVTQKSPFDFEDETIKPSVEPQELKEIKKEITKLADKVKLIQNMFWEEKSPKLDEPLPPEFAEIYRLASQSGMDKEHLDSIMKLTLSHMPLKMRENSTTVKRYFQTLLRKMVPIRLEQTPSLGERKIMMLVGPTGVGKTTSIAKLAAKYSFMMQKKYKVGLIVLDTYRIGAVEQLMQYARMMKLAIEIVVDPPEFSTALNALSYCDYILIDTMGSSPYDKKKIEQIYECLEQGSSNFEIDVTLALPASIKYEDLLVAYNNFSPLNLDTVMFTKLDESKGFGNIFSFVLETKLPINYFSVGQEVPEDLVVASSDFLVECLLNGFDRSKI